jgi:hypothetical protein
MLSTALAYAKRGVAIFPCLPGDKRPATGHGCKDATLDLDQITEWWRAEPESNIAAATGAISKMFAVDVDGLDAESELRRLERQHGAIPETVTSITARGRHLFFRMPLDISVRCSAGKLGPNLDVRADGGYCILPPSRHPSGKRYCWSVDSASAFADAPQWLLDKISERGAARISAPSDWRALVSNPVVEGTRDCTLARVTGHLLRKYVDPLVTLELVQAFNERRCVPPLPEDDVVRVVNSVCGIEARRRGGHGG